MKIFTSPAEMQSWSRAELAAGHRIACVPTMGFLHEGHLSLVRRARREAERVVLTLFVNPTQFGPGEDYETYPRDIRRDQKLCEGEGVDVMFMPAAGAMYAPGASVSVVESRLSKLLCGASRPGHFNGVCTVVSKLFNCVMPHVAVFGEKDAQQAVIIRRMVRDLNFPVEIVLAPIIREPDGLAMSSRNTRLSPEERHAATGLSRALRLAHEACGRGECDGGDICRLMEHEMTTAGLRVDYAAAVDPDDLQPRKTVTPGTLLLVAAFAGKTRLIDNCLL